MKKTISRILFFLALTSASPAALLSWTSSYADPVYIPDGSPTGWSETLSFEAGESPIVNVSVRFNVSGGYNGDLYVYLAHNGQTAVLLNRVGRSSASEFGYGDAGMNVVFRDPAAFGDIHAYQQVAGYTLSGGAVWQPDGRIADPRYSDFTDARSKLLSGFNGMDAGGSWTLFASDLSGGGVSRIEEWGLDIETASVVPEPVNTALVFFGAAMLAVGMQRRSRRRK